MHICPHHLEVPAKVLIIGWTAICSLATITWQFAGHMLSIITPDEITKMDERTVYISAIIILGGALGWLTRWVLFKLLAKLDESNLAHHANAIASHANAQSNRDVAAALHGLNARVDGVMIETVTNAIHASFPPGLAGQTATLGSSPSPRRKQG